MDITKTMIPAIP